MYLLKDNKLIHIETREDSMKDITILITLEQLQEDHEEKFGRKNEHYIGDKVYTLFAEHGDRFGYCFRVTQSEYKDKSNMNNGLGFHDTIGDAIKSAMHKGLIVLREGKPLF